MSQVFQVVLYPRGYLQGSSGVPPWDGDVRFPGEPFGGRSAGVIRGEEKQRR